MFSTYCMIYFYLLRGGSSSAAAPQSNSRTHCGPPVKTFSHPCPKTNSNPKPKVPCCSTSSPHRPAVKMNCIGYAWYRPHEIVAGARPAGGAVSMEGVTLISVPTQHVVDMTLKPQHSELEKLHRADLRAYEQVTPTFEPHWFKPRSSCTTLSISAPALTTVQFEQSR